MPDTHSKIAHVIRLLRADVAAEITLADMADHADLSPFHFHRIFLQTMGATPGNFLTALRMDAAKRLLLTSTESVTDICFAVGYSSPGAFTTGFGHLVGESPSGFRTLARTFLESGLWEAHFATEPEVPLPGIKGFPLGKVIGPPEFRGAIFVGAFPKRLPQALPLAGTLLERPGLYAFNSIPGDGCYHVMAAAVPAHEPQSLFLPRSGMLVGIGKRPLVVAQGKATYTVDVVLRRLTQADPPVVVALPILLRRR